MIGLALSGGGVKGAAHIGVLRALEENDINVDVISGSSSGSIIASLYACGYTAKQIEIFFKRSCKAIKDYDYIGIAQGIVKSIVKGKLHVYRLIKGNNLERILRYYFLRKNIKSIRDVEIPLAIPTVDIDTGRVCMFVSNKKYIKSKDDIEYFCDEDLAKIVRASCAFPGIFTPYILKNRKLVDGGIKDCVPVNILKQYGVDTVIAVMFDKAEDEYRYKDYNILELFTQSLDIIGNGLNEFGTMAADHLIIPQLGKTKLLEFEKIDQCIKAGYEATIKSISEIKKVCNKSRR